MTSNILHIDQNAIEITYDNSIDYIYLVNKDELSYTLLSFSNVIAAQQMSVFLCLNGNKLK